MKKWLIDTDVLIDYLRGSKPAAAFLEEILQHDTCYLSVITVAELYAGVKEGKERQSLELFLQSFTTIPLDNVIAECGGIYRRDYSKSHGVGLADALIAATTNIHQARLITLNAKHFPMLKNVYTPYKKS